MKRPDLKLVTVYGSDISEWSKKDLVLLVEFYMAKAVDPFPDGLRLARLQEYFVERAKS